MKGVKTISNAVEAFVGIFNGAFEINLLFRHEFRGGCFVGRLSFGMLRV